MADSSMAAISEEGLVTVKRDAKWIQDLEAADAANVAKNRYALSTASGTRETIVTATTEDGQKAASCKIVVEFKTTDQTTKTSSSSSGGSGGGSSSGRFIQPPISRQYQWTGERKRRVDSGYRGLVV